eukprot:5539433-Amphidinium_carterae.1
MGSDQALNMNGASIVSRVPKNYSPSKQKPLTSIVRAVVVAAEAGTGKRVTACEESTEQKRFTPNTLIEEDGENCHEMSFMEIDIADPYHWVGQF